MFNEMLFVRWLVGCLLFFWLLLLLSGSYQKLRRKRFVLISNPFSGIGFVLNSHAIKSLIHSDIIKMCTDKKKDTSKFSDVDSFFIDIRSLVSEFKQQRA